MKYLHTMIRVRDVDATLRFFCNGLGLRETRRKDNPAGKYTLIFLAAPESPEAEIELTHNWDSTEDYGSARNFGHLAFRVDDIYETCDRLAKMGVVINRPPRDGHMAFVRSPDLISIELLQKGDALAPREPWSSMPNTGVW
jgi:lactoylglutathione lyase